ncbi:Serine/threonine protein kinase [Gracilaria domingensis]|nr:Serine/threonine protein kinase [Gracilaria domingensis]
MATPRSKRSLLRFKSSPSARVNREKSPEGEDNEKSAKYRQSVEMSGWVLKCQRLRAGHVKRYFRLHNSVLSNHPQLTAPPTWEISVSKCIVRTNEQKNLVNLRLVDRQIRFQLTTQAEMKRWAEALRSGSVCNIEDFYRLEEEIGHGSFGAVKVAYDISTNEKRAVKIVKRTTNAKELEFLQREIDVLLSISHPHVVRTHDIFDEKEKIFMVMDFIDGGDLFDFMVRKTKLSEESTKLVIWQMLQGLSYLHSSNIVHRDIKPENVLVQSVHPLIIRITDFGFANFVDPSSSAPQTDLKSMVGTGCYMAPEVIDSRGHGKPVDIYSTGVVMFRLLSGRLPFRGMTLKECYKQAMKEEADFHTREWGGISPEAKELCKRMLSAKPDVRPSAENALVHRWFADDKEFKNSLEAIEGVSS